MSKNKTFHHNPYNLHWRLFVESLSPEDKSIVNEIQVKEVNGFMDRLPSGAYPDVPEELRDFYTLEVVLDVKGEETLLRRLDYLSCCFSLERPYMHEIGWLVDGVRSDPFSIDGKRLGEALDLSEKEEEKITEMFFERYDMSFHYSNDGKNIKEFLKDKQKKEREINEKRKNGWL